MRIQFFSDIHLEFGDFAIPDTDADVLVAAGDIGLGASGIEWLKSAGKPVVFVAGNHEFYAGEYAAVRAALAAATAGSSVHLLEDSEAQIDGVRFVGGTLWTDFNGADPALMSVARNSMNDYLQIRCGEGPLVPAHTLEANARTRRWLHDALARPFDGRTVVVTHHAPSFRSWQADPDSPLRYAYCNDLHGLIARPPVDLWIHGHVHYVSDYLENGVRILCNPRGYHGYQNVRGFDPARIVEI